MHGCRPNFGSSYLGPCARWSCTGLPGPPGQPACLEQREGPTWKKGKWHMVTLGGMSQARQAAFVHDVDADSSDGGLCSPQGPPHGPLQPHRLPPALPPGGRAVASSRGSGPCHSLHCRISHRRPHIGAGSARSGGGRGRQRKGRKAWRLGGRWRGSNEGLPLPPPDSPWSETPPVSPSRVLGAPWWLSPVPGTHGPSHLVSWLWRKRRTSCLIRVMFLPTCRTELFSSV